MVYTGSMHLVHNTKGLQARDFSMSYQASSDTCDRHAIKLKTPDFVMLAMCYAIPFFFSSPSDMFSRRTTLYLVADFGQLRISSQMVWTKGVCKVP